MKARKPVDPQATLFRPGSVSKLFTWTAVMQLVEQGKLDLNMDVNTYLDFKIPATFPQPVTLRHLMSHTPGFEDEYKDLFKLEAGENIPLDQFLKTHIPARVYAPGTVSAYSNYGAALAGYIVERVSGMPFSQYVDKNITGPLGMTHSTFTQPLPADLAGEMSGGYNFANGDYLQGAFEIISAYPAGGFSATAGDMARFMIAHLQDGRFEGAQILKPSTAMLMHSNLFSQDPALHGMAYGFFEDEVNVQRVISHGGDTILFHSGLYLLPDQNLGIFLSTNSVGGGRSVAPIFKAFMNRYYPVTPPAAVTPPPDFVARAPLYAGEFYASRNNFSGPLKIAMLANSAHLRTDGEGHVFMVGPVTNRYTEVIPGQLETTEGMMTTLVLRSRPNGEVTLLTSLPMELIKTPWYATSTLHGLIFIGGLLLFLVTLIAWLVSFIRGLRRGAAAQSGARLVQSHPGAAWGDPLVQSRPSATGGARLVQSRPGARLARGAASLFMLGFIVFVVSFAALLLNIDPLYGAPRFIFNGIPGTSLILILPPILAALGAATLVFAVLAWVKRYWSAAGRVFYTLLAVWFAAVLWGMWYWNWLG